jgi:hypothetical protein
LAIEEETFKKSAFKAKTDNAKNKSTLLITIPLNKNVLSSLFIN